MIYKTIAFILLAIMVICMGAVIGTGIQKKSGTSPSVIPHQWYARFLLMFTIIFIVFIEMGVRTRGGIVSGDPLFWIHLVCASTFLILLVLMNFFFSGEQSIHHALLGYITATAFGGMIATGIPLLLRL